MEGGGRRKEKEKYEKIKRFDKNKLTKPCPKIAILMEKNLSIYEKEQLLSLT